MKRKKTKKAGILPSVGECVDRLVDEIMRRGPIHFKSSIWPDERRSGIPFRALNERRKVARMPRDSRRSGTDNLKDEMPYNVADYEKMEVFPWPGFAMEVIWSKTTRGGVTFSKLSKPDVDIVRKHQELPKILTVRSAKKAAG